MVEHFAGARVMTAAWDMVPHLTKFYLLRFQGLLLMSLYQQDGITLARLPQLALLNVGEPTGTANLEMDQERMVEEALQEMFLSLLEPQ